jgi:hypothetical protein
MAREGTSESVGGGVRRYWVDNSPVSYIDVSFVIEEGGKWQLQILGGDPGGIVILPQGGNNHVRIKQRREF